jgi:hypothetical protein
MSDPKFFRNYIDILSEAPVAQTQKPVSKDDQNYQQWAVADQNRRMWQYGHTQAQSYDDPVGKDYIAVGGKETDDLVNKFGAQASAAAGSPEKEAQFKQRYQQDMNPDNITLKPDDSYQVPVQEDEVEQLKKLIKR